MSYIRAQVVDQTEPDNVEYGFDPGEIDFNKKSTLDYDLDFGALAFASDLLDQIENLPEGQAIVIWKEIG